MNNTLLKYQEPSDQGSLERLLAHVTSARYVHSHRWRQSDVVVWDNRAVLHTASPCDSSRHPRLLFRTAIR